MKKNVEVEIDISGEDMAKEMKKLINKILCHFCKHFLVCPYCARYENEWRGKQ